MALGFISYSACFNTQPPEGGWRFFGQIRRQDLVSTHSRLKAAGTSTSPNLTGVKCFNTQPPEGGWGGSYDDTAIKKVSTHSRLKAAGNVGGIILVRYKKVSTHSRLKAAGAQNHGKHPHQAVSTHSRLKAAGKNLSEKMSQSQRFNTQPPEGGWTILRRFRT